VNTQVEANSSLKEDALALLRVLAEFASQTVRCPECSQEHEAPEAPSPCPNCGYPLPWLDPEGCTHES